VFPVEMAKKKGNALSSLLSRLALYYHFRKVKVNRHSLELNGAYRVLVCTDDINTLGRTVYSIHKNILSLARWGPAQR